MNPKLIKIDEEHAKNDARIAKLQARNRKLEEKRREIENTDILGLVHGMGLTTDQLSDLIHGMKPKHPQAAEAPKQEDHAHAEQ